MNIILKIILLNLLLIYSLKYNNKLLCLLIILFSLYMLYMYYYMNNIIEGNTTLDEYKMNFAGLLNKDIKTSYREDILYDRILDNFTRLLRLMDKSEGRVPPNQMCKGELGEWSECSRECGRGQMTRRFNMTQQAGEYGIKCIYEDGQQETKECFDRLCKFHEPCEENHDCLSNYCSKSDRICTYPHICERDKLENCNNEQCMELENKYGDYTYDVEQQRCINKYIDINIKELSEQEEISLEVKSVEEREKQRVNESIARKINTDFPRICELAMSPPPGQSSNNCPSVQNAERNCNKHNEQGIPCYYDYEGGECKKVSKYPDYTNSDKWKEIVIELDIIPTNEQNFKETYNSVEDFFNCDNLKVEANNR